jgi:hypothetical protein
VGSTPCSCGERYHDVGSDIQRRRGDRERPGEYMESEHLHEIV